MLLLVFCLFYLFTRNNKDKNIKSIQIGSTVLNNIEIADTGKKREQGLSGKNNIGGDYGMLFIFEKPGFYAFWMKDMNFAIDIIWLDENYTVVGIKVTLRRLPTQKVSNQKI